MKDNLEWLVSTLLNYPEENSGSVSLENCMHYLRAHFVSFCNVLIACLLMYVSSPQGGVTKKMSGV